MTTLRRHLDIQATNWSRQRRNTPTQTKAVAVRSLANASRPEVASTTTTCLGIVVSVTGSLADRPRRKRPVWRYPEDLNLNEVKGQAAIDRWPRSGLGAGLETPLVAIRLERASPLRFWAGDDCENV